MSENSANSKRIARNTLMLYFRMILIMGVTLYTSRVVLNALGVADYGIYDVVGGIVALFTMISGSLSSSISRFITFELGRENQERLNMIFSTSVIIQIVIGVIIAILVETLGMWFLTNKMVIPPDRLVAAKWVLQFSLITLIIKLISIPYNAVIIAHERMSAFAYISVLEAVGNLAIAYFITLVSSDKLIFYAGLMSLVALAVRFTYGAYCRRHFEEAKFRWAFDKELLKEMFGFAGWNYIGSASAVLRDQGSNMLINILGGGPVVNAARGISTQVQVAIVSFASNFMMAMNPQITKSYANGNRDYMMTLIFQGARYAFYMMLLISMPILFNTHYVLELWLKEVPEYAVIFVQLSLVLGICEVISQPLITAMLATGDIKRYQIIVGGILLANIPISYLFLKLGYDPTVIFVIAILLSLGCLAARLYLVRDMIGLSSRKFVKSVVLNVTLVAFVSSIAPFAAMNYVCDGIWGFLALSAISVVGTLLSIYFVGCSGDERQFVWRQVANRVFKK